MRHQVALKILLVIVLLMQATLSAKDLKQEIRKAESGDFVVYAYKQQLTLLRVASNDGKELVVEEISAPNPEIKKWQEWLSTGAPGHSSWTVSHIAIDNGAVKSVYNVDEKAYVTTPITFPFLPTLLTTPLSPIESSARKYIGAQPLAGEVDLRRLWFPKIIFEGQAIETPIEVYRLVWPRDDSELSGKSLDLYFPTTKAISYLPYWIEMSVISGKIKISAIDSGKGLTSPDQAYKTACHSGTFQIQEAILFPLHGHSCICHRSDVLG